MTVRELAAALEELDPSASIVVVNEETGNYWPIERVGPSEDPPKGEKEAWIYMIDA